MAISIGDALLHLGVDSSGLDADMKKATQNIKNEMKATGLAMTAFGAAITGALAMSVKSYAAEESGVIKLTAALRNVGVAYDDVKDSLEANIEATQQKTSIADDKQREALQALLEITGNYNQALALLPQTMDMAIATSMDFGAAADIVGKVAMGNTGILSRYGIVLKEGATATEALGELQKKYAGQAEAYGKTLSGQLELLKNNIGDIQEAVGGLVANAIQPAVTNIQNLVVAVKSWINLNPELSEQIVISTAKIGLFSLTLGGLLLSLPKIIGFITAITGMFGPWGIAIAVVAVGLGILVGKLTGAGDAIQGLKTAMHDIQTEMFKTQIAQTLSEKKWAEIQKRGYLTEQQFADLADAMGYSTTQLYIHLEAADMLARGLNTLGDKNIWLREEFKKTTEAVIEGTDAMAESAEKLEDPFDRLMKMLRYNETEAAEYAITTDDVYQAMLRLGYTEDDIRGKFEQFGDETFSVNDLLKQLDLTARDVAYVLGQLKDETDETTDAFKRQSDEIYNAQKTVQEFYDAIAAAENASDKESRILAYWRAKIAESTGVPTDVRAAAVQDVYASQEQSQLTGGHAMTLSEALKARGYAAGGIITEPTLLTRLRDMKPYGVMAERGPETISPINFDSIADAIRQGLAGMTVLVEVGGRQVEAVISRQMYRRWQGKI